MWARLADSTLLLCLVFGVLASGAWRLDFLPVLSLAVAMAYLFAMLAIRAEGRPVRVPALVVGLLLLASLTALQALPVDLSVLSVLSPEAYDLRKFSAPQLARGFVSYETGSTLQEVAKLLTYALMAQTAYERVRSRGRFDQIAGAVAVVAVLSLCVGVLHRLLGLDRLYGFVELRVPASSLLTTMVNPNHAAGVMVLGTLCAAGLAVEVGASRARFWWFSIAALCGVVSMLSYSRGGLVALLLGLGLFGVLMLWRRRGRRRVRGLSASGGLLAAGLAPIFLGFTLPGEELLKDLSSGARVAGLSEKLAAVQDTIPLLQDHPWLGIGRGAFGSVYPRYRTSSLQVIFVYPENLVAQYLAEWGVLLGSVALLALTFVLAVRLLRGRAPSVIGAVSGATALVVQNLVDFSLEMPGVALLLAAVLGGAGFEFARSRKLKVDRPFGFVALTAAPMVALSGVLLLAWNAGDPFFDQKRLERLAMEASSAPGVSHLQEAKQIAGMHPANGYMASLVSRVAELEVPQDLGDALSWANRALYLSPRYADAHSLTGRLLIKLGYRDQGFSEFRRAWALAAGGVDRVIREVVYLARSEAELHVSVPRRDLAFGVPDEVQLSRMIRMLPGLGKAEWAIKLLPELGSLSSATSEGASAIAHSAASLGQFEYAMAAAQLVPENSAQGPQARLLRAELLFQQGSIEEARKALDALINNLPKDMHLVPHLKARLKVALGTQELALARELVHEIGRLVPPTRRNQAELLKLEADVEHQAGNLVLAGGFLDRAVRLEPGNLGLRLQRAEVLRSIGRSSEAQSDLEFVLRRRPEDVAVKKMLGRIRASASPSP